VAKQLLIYDNIQPLSSEVHRNWTVSLDDYSYASHLITSPLLAAEVAFAASEYPIVFSATPDEGEFVPLAVMGVKEGENLMIDESGQFTTRFVPAFIRRYPFVFGGDRSADSMTLCIDVDSKMVHKDGSKGQRMFEDSGEQSVHLKDIVEFLKDYHFRSEITRAFGKRLHELGLLEPMEASISMSGAEGSEGASFNLKGFYAVKPEKLKAISDADALELFKKGGLEIIYAHLQSLNCFNGLIEKLNNRLKAA